MTTREQARARANNQKMAQYTELWIVGNPDEIAHLMGLANQAGLLVYASAPTAMGGGDPRHRRYLRLRSRNHH